MFNKVLVANRGEIAVRIIRALKELKIETIAIYSEADNNSLHTKLADEAYCIGPYEASESYLNIPSIMSVAEITGVDAIHPGYGFLAENSHFAEVCETTGIKFIGPRSESIELMGNKAKAREMMSKSGVPVIPGTEDSLKNIDDIYTIAENIGYPIIIKASAGGGGKGMRIVEEADTLEKFMQMAKNEAKAAFENEEIYLEKYIEGPHHVEFQIIADEHGNVVHLGERDCSIQRRYQKVVEESPSTALTPELRNEMGEIAVKAAEAANYTNAGTVEFLLDDDGNYYFIEMNTRIQVEHPVTEMVTGIDLIKEQLRVAAGEKLGYEQDDIDIRGVAIECRINAEDTNNKFMPSPGKIDNYIIPGGPGIRIDSGVYPGYFITPYYDSMLAKLIVWAPDRESALDRMERALHEFIIEGITTTIPFHLKIMSNPYFRSGNFDTHFIDKHL